MWRTNEPDDHISLGKVIRKGNNRITISTSCLPPPIQITVRRVSCRLLIYEVYKCTTLDDIQEIEYTSTCDFR